MFGFIFTLLILAGVFFYWYGKRDKVSKSNTRISKITMAKELSSLPVPHGTQGQEATFNTNIVGVTYKNTDGVARQTLIKIYAKAGLSLDIDFYLYEGNIACGVFLDGNQLGNLSSELAQELFNFIKKGGYVEVQIVSSGEAENTGEYGVTVSIRKIIREAIEKTSVDKNMKQCKTCKNMISKNARTCPHCGESYEKKESKSIGLGTIILFLIVIMWIGGKMGTATSTPEKPIVMTIAQKEQKAEKIKLELENIPEHRIYKRRDRYEELTTLLPLEQEYKERYEYYVKEVKAIEENIGAKPQTSVWDGVPTAVDRYWKMTLKDYDSLKDESCGPLNFSDDGWTTLCKYRARNGFGGYVLEQSFYRIKHNTVVDTWK